MYNVWLPDYDIRKPIEYQHEISGHILAQDFQKDLLFIGGDSSITKVHYPSGNASVIFTGNSDIKGNKL